MICNETIRKLNYSVSGLVLKLKELYNLTYHDWFMIYGNTLNEESNVKFKTFMISYLNEMVLKYKQELVSKLENLELKFRTLPRGNNIKMFPGQTEQVISLDKLINQMSEKNSKRLQKLIDKY